ncbi:MAG: hypothetical protein OEZ39_05730 [Gammaproteobacteria bacterium]|nr:hypothetical protein [Gammaproteobacteria bacterium]MDH5651355.1 hypothetical protein [Gammaproteobacteria bacterium]
MNHFLSRLITRHSPGMQEQQSGNGVSIVKPQIGSYFASQPFAAEQSWSDYEPAIADETETMVSSESDQSNDIVHAATRPSVVQQAANNTTQHTQPLSEGSRQSVSSHHQQQSVAEHAPAISKSPPVPPVKQTDHLTSANVSGEILTPANSRQPPATPSFTVREGLDEPDGISELSVTEQPGKVKPASVATSVREQNEKAAATTVAEPAVQAETPRRMRRAVPVQHNTPQTQSQRLVSAAPDSPAAPIIEPKIVKQMSASPLRETTSSVPGYTESVDMLVPEEGTRSEIVQQHTRQTIVTTSRQVTRPPRRGNQTHGEMITEQSISMGAEQHRSSARFADETPDNSIIQVNDFKTAVVTQPPQTDNTPPTINVSIGRIEVRAPAPAPVETRPAYQPQRRGPTLSLSDYLKSRGGGK